MEKVAAMRETATIIEQSTGRITFRVDDVEPADRLLPTACVSDSLAEATGTPLLAMSHAASFPVVAQDGAAANPLARAVHLAFSQHRPLILGPDEIWITIEQGLAQHINNNAERLRGQFVDFGAKKRIVVETEGLPMWALAELWAQGIRHHVGRKVYDLMVADFSTTTAVARTVSLVVMMDAFKRYFDYSLSLICGIPRVTLLGTPQDWEEISRRIRAMTRYGLGWWTERLVPVADGLVRSAEGRPGLAFWQALYSPKENYGYSRITGWLANLFPYLKHAVTDQCTERNHFVTWPSEPGRWDRGKDASSPGSGVSLAALPAGLSVAHFSGVEGTRTTALELLGGFIGVAQDPATGALRPELGWAVRAGDLYATVLSGIAADHKVHPPVDLSALEELHARLSEVPADIIQMLDVFDGAYLADGMKHPVRFLARSRWFDVTDSRDVTTTFFAELADGRRVGYRHVRDFQADRVNGGMVVSDGWDVVVAVVRVGHGPSSTGILREQVAARSVRDFIMRIVEARGGYYFDEPAFAVPPRESHVVKRR
jgi:hypothetical protein